MRGLAFALVGMMASAPASAEWERLGSMPGSVIEINRATIRENGGVRTAWVRYEYSPLYQGQIKRSVHQEMVRCSREESAARAIIDYDAGLNVLKQYRFEDFELKWRSYPPDTLGSGVINAICA